MISKFCFDWFSCYFSFLEHKCCFFELFYHHTPSKQTQVSTTFCASPICRIFLSKICKTFSFFNLSNSVIASLCFLTSMCEHLIFSANTHTSPVIFSCVRVRDKSCSRLVFLWRLFYRRVLKVCVSDWRMDAVE